jgi:hypothetical protein
MQAAIAPAALGPAAYPAPDTLGAAADVLLVKKVITRLFLLA